MLIWTLSDQKHRFVHSAAQNFTEKLDRNEVFSARSIDAITRFFPALTVHYNKAWLQEYEQSILLIDFYRISQ